MADSTVLLTGATGFIGFRILLDLLRQGYGVRVVVRSAAKATYLDSRLKEITTASNRAKFAYTVVEDFAQPGAFEEAVTGMRFVIHVASPITSSDDPADWERDFKHVAINGTIGILESCKSSQTVRRVVITSSIMALFTLKDLFQKAPDTPLHADMRAVEPSPPYAFKMLAYLAGKCATLNRTEGWALETQPGFDIVHLCPSFVIGRDELATSKDDLCKFSSNWHALQIVLGKDNPVGKPVLTCHIDDVVRCHIAALDQKVPGSQSYVISCSPNDGLDWDQAKDFVRERFGQEVQAGVLPNNGHMPTVNKSVRLDVRKTEQTFGFVHASYQAQVLDIVGQYVELERLEWVARQRAVAGPLKSKRWLTFPGRESTTGRAWLAFASTVSRWLRWCMKGGHPNV